MRTIVIIPGGFHPFHAGHAALYKSAVKAFDNADVYVAATNDTKTRPFPFAIKEKLAKLAGVAGKHFVQVKSPFKAEEITQYYNPDEDVLVFVRSEKDKTEQPKPGGTKKDGSQAYFQPWTGKNLQPFSKHAYIAYLPTVEFGPGITSATEIRNAWPTLNDKRKTAMVMSLYPVTQKNPKLAANVVKMLDMGMGDQEGVAEGSLNEFDYNKYVKMLNAYMKKLGYSYIGQGTDAHVFAKEQGSVVKVLIPKSGDISTAKNPFLAFLNYCEKNAGNPHLPKFTETTKEPIQIGSEKFDQVVMERLQDVDPKYEDLLVSITDSIEEGKPLDPQYQPYTKFYQTLKSVMLTGRKLGFENDIITFQSVNIMQRGNTLVIIDPWTGTGKQGVAEGLLNEFVPPNSDKDDGGDSRSRRIRKLLEIAIQVAKEKNIDELGMIHGMNMVAGDEFFNTAVEGILSDITDKEYMFVLQSAYKTVKQGLAEAKKKRKKKSRNRSLGRYFFPGYSYYGGGGESGESGGDGGGEGMAEGLGIPYPTTYEQENNKFKRRGPMRITDLTEVNQDYLNEI